MIIDEASFLRADVFSELYTINQFNFDSEKRFALILVGQITLIYHQLTNNNWGITSIITLKLVD